MADRGLGGFPRGILDKGGGRIGVLEGLRGGRRGPGGGNRGFDGFSMGFLGVSLINRGSDRGFMEGVWGIE